MGGKLLVPSSRSRYLSWLAVMGLCLYTRIFFFSDWIAHDEGSLGQSAERVLNGQIPHRDFDELYSGGLSYVHSWVFNFFGVGVRQIREFHWWVFSAFLTGVFAASVRILRSHGLALFLVALLTVWGPINYPASMPSWHVLYLSFLAGLSLSLVGVDQRQKRDSWLYWVLGGAILGAAPWIKVTGIYAAIGIFQWLWASWLQHRVPRQNRVILGIATLSLLGPAFCSLLIQGERVNLENFFWFSLPIFLHSALVTRMFWFRQLPTVNGRDLLYFTLSFSAVAIVLLLIMVSKSGVDPLIRGIFVLPRLRLDAAVMDPPSIATVLLPLLTISLTFAFVIRFWSWIKAHGLILFLVFSIFGFLAGSSDYWYRWCWALLRALPLILPILMFVFQRNLNRPVLIFSTLFCWIGLSQFPFAHGIYLIYCLPLALAALLFSLPVIVSRLKGAILGHLIALITFGVIWINFGDWRSFGSRFLMRQQGRLVNDPRIGIQLPEETARFWEELLPHLRVTIPEGSTLLAFPDAPEISFLAGRPSPDRGFYEFFENQSVREKQRQARDPGKIEAKGVVINLDPEFSEGLDRSTLGLWMRSFPKSYVKGKFLILERE